MTSKPARARPPERKAKALVSSGTSYRAARGGHLRGPPAKWRHLTLWRRREYQFCALSCRSRRLLLCQRIGSRVKAKLNDLNHRLEFINWMERRRRRPSPRRSRLAANEWTGPKLVRAQTGPRDVRQNGRKWKKMGQVGRAP